MSLEAIQLPSFPVLSKPKYGEACNGCGWCCHEEICMVGKIFLDLPNKDNFIKGACPLMAYEDGKVRCGVVLAEQRMNIKPITAEALGIGQGCDASDEIKEQNDQH